MILILFVNFIHERMTHMWCEQTNNGKWKYIERYVDPMTNREKRVSVTLKKNTSQAKKQAQKILHDKIKEKIDKQGIYTECITFEFMIKAYRKAQILEVKQSTYKRNYYTSETLLSILGRDTLVDRFSAHYVRNALLHTKKKAGTLNEYLRRFRAIMHWGYENDFIDNIQFLDKLKNFNDTPHRKKIESKYLESIEVSLVLNNMYIPYWRDLTEFLILSGLRFGEAAALEFKDINLKQRLIYVTKTYDVVNKVTTTPKTSCSIREIYIQDEFYDLCEKIRRKALCDRMQTGSNLLFQNKNSNDFHIGYAGYLKYLKKVSKEFINRSITPHVLRHTHASLLFEAELDIETISRRLGHENSKVTRDIYIHITEKLKEKDRAKIAQIQIL